MILCDDIHCNDEAEYIIHWGGRHPTSLLFKEQNFVYKKHLKEIMRDFKSSVDEGEIFIFYKNLKYLRRKR